MFGLPEALMSFIRRQVGLRTDAASASGSLHAKMGDVKNTVFPWHKKAATLTTGSLVILADNTAIDVVSISGDRVILGGHIASGAYPHEHWILKVEIDGVTIINRIFSSLGLNIRANGPESLVLTYPEPCQWVLPLPQGLHFSTSLKVIVHHGGVGGDDTDLGVVIWHVPA